MSMSRHKHPRVSIIIPCYGQAQYLSDAIDSALSQTYPNIEVIVVNDGSPDNTEGIARPYGDRIIYLEQENRGLATARNTGIAKSSGQWLQFLDADDLIHEKKVEWQLEDLVHSGARLGYCCTVNFEGSSPCLFKEIIYPGQIEDMFLALACVWRFSPIPIHAVLLSRDIVEKYGCFPEDIQANEDRLFFATIAFAGERFRFTPIVGALYRQHPGSMKRDAGRMLEAHHAFLASIWRLSCNGGRCGDSIRKAVMRSLLNVAESSAAKGCVWSSVKPVLQLYMDVHGFEERRTLRRVLSERWLRRLWLLRQRARLKL